MKNKLTLDDVTGAIADKKFSKLGEKTTVCLLTLRNGFEVTGTSSCVDPREYSQEIGERLAYEKAELEVWKLEAYLLQQKRANAARQVPDAGLEPIPDAPIPSEPSSEGALDASLSGIGG